MPVFKFYVKYHFHEEGSVIETHGLATAYRLAAGPSTLAWFTFHRAG